MSNFARAYGRLRPPPAVALPLCALLGLILGWYLRSAPVSPQWGFALPDLENRVWLGASLKHANLRDLNLRGALLERADLTGANLGASRLDGANLRSANLLGANLGGASLVGADLRGASLREANLDGASLRHARLEGAHLEQADLRFTDLRDVDLSGVGFDAGTEWPVGMVPPQPSGVRERNGRAGP